MVSGSLQFDGFQVSQPCEFYSVGPRARIVIEHSKLQKQMTELQLSPSKCILHPDFQHVI